MVEKAVSANSILSEPKVSAKYLDTAILLLINT